MDDGKNEDTTYGDLGGVMFTMGEGLVVETIEENVDARQRAINLLNDIIITVTGRKVHPVLVDALVNAISEYVLERHLTVEPAPIATGGVVMTTPKKGSK